MEEACQLNYNFTTNNLKPYYLLLSCGLQEQQLTVTPTHTDKGQISQPICRKRFLHFRMPVLDRVVLSIFLYLPPTSIPCSGLNVICCVSISLSTWAVSRWTQSWLHLVSADSSPLCLWLFGSQSALAKHAAETSKELPLRFAVAQLATSTQGGLKPTFFAPGKKPRERLTLPHHPLPSSANTQHNHEHGSGKMNTALNGFLCCSVLWLMNS